MKLGETGEAFFVEEVEEGDNISPLLGTSPLPTSVLHSTFSVTTENVECQKHDLSIDNSLLPSNVPNTVVSDVSPSSEVIEGVETPTHQSAEIQDDKTKDEDLELGIIKRVKKSGEKKDVRSSYTQTDESFKLAEVPKKGMKEAATTKNQKLGRNDGNGSRRSSLLAEAHGSKTDGEETVKGLCFSHIKCLKS